jgi:predicted RNase H-like nuclease (RuvC/YqgF family)
MVVSECKKCVAVRKLYGIDNDEAENLRKVIEDEGHIRKKLEEKVDELERGNEKLRGKLSEIESYVSRKIGEEMHHDCVQGILGDLKRMLKTTKIRNSLVVEV